MGDAKHEDETPDRQVMIQLGRDVHGGALADRMRYFKSLTADERLALRARYLDITVDEVAQRDATAGISTQADSLGEIEQ